MNEEKICEYCCDIIDTDPKDLVYEPVTGLSPSNVTIEFCSDDCKREYEHDVLVGQREAAREYEMFGTDYDSWYR